MKGFMSVRNLCLGDCGAHVPKDHRCCGRAKCQERITEMICDGLKKIRHIRRLKQPMRVPALAAAIKAARIVPPTLEAPRVQV